MDIAQEFDDFRIITNKYSKMLINERNILKKDSVKDSYRFINEQFDIEIRKNDGVIISITHEISDDVEIKFGEQIIITKYFNTLFYDKIFPTFGMLNTTSAFLESRFKKNMSFEKIVQVLTKINSKLNGRIE